MLAVPEEISKSTSLGFIWGGTYSTQHSKPPPTRETDSYARPSSPTRHTIQQSQRDSGDLNGRFHAKRSAGGSIFIETAICSENKKSCSRDNNAHEEKLVNDLRVRDTRRESEKLNDMIANKK